MFPGVLLASFGVIATRFLEIVAKISRIPSTRFEEGSPEARRWSRPRLVSYTPGPVFRITFGRFSSCSSYGSPRGVLKGDSRVPWGSASDLLAIENREDAPSWDATKFSWKEFPGKVIKGRSMRKREKCSRVARAVFLMGNREGDL